MTQIIKRNKFGKINPANIIQFEKVNNVLLRDGYKIFLQEHNGGQHLPGTWQDQRGSLPFCDAKRYGNPKNDKILLTYKQTIKSVGSTL
ncbi:MAG: hypothetical protein ABIX01_09760 [Chitinophagaceae bacterium]